MFSYRTLWLCVLLALTFSLSSCNEQVKTTDDHTDESPTQMPTRFISPLATPIVVPMYGEVTCNPEHDAFRCHDSLLDLDFVLPAFMGRVVDTVARPGGIDGYFYEYDFDTLEESVGAGGRSRDFSEARGGSTTDQTGFKARSNEQICASWLSQLCQDVRPGILFMVAFPDSEWYCGGGMIPIATPRVLISLNLPDHSLVNGFGFTAPLFPDNMDRQARTDWDQAITTELCSPEGKAAFDADMKSLRTNLEAGTADPVIQVRYNALIELAQSIESPYIRGETLSPHNDGVQPSSPIEAPIETTSEADIMDETSPASDDAAMLHLHALSDVTALTTINVRSGPGLRFGVIDTLTAGEIVSVAGISNDGEWWMLPDERGGVGGWISADPALTSNSSLDLREASDDSLGLAPRTPSLVPEQILESGASQIEFSSNDRLMAIRAFNPDLDGPQIQVYDTQNWQILWTAAASERSSENFAFSPDGFTLAATGRDGNLSLRDAMTGRLIFELSDAQWTGRPHFSADGMYLAAVKSPRIAAVVNAMTGEFVGEYENRLPIREMTISPNGPWLAIIISGSWGAAELLVWDIFTHEQRTLGLGKSVPYHSNVAFSPDTGYVAASLASQDPVHIWQTQTWPEVEQLHQSDGQNNLVRFDRAGNQLAVLSIAADQGQSTVTVWDINTWKKIREIAMGDIAWDIAFSPDGDRIASVHGQSEPLYPPPREGRLWDVESGILLAKMPHDRTVRGLAFSHDGKWVVTGSDKTVVWRLK